MCKFLNKILTKFYEKFCITHVLGQKFYDLLRRLFCVFLSLILKFVVFDILAQSDAVEPEQTSPEFLGKSPEP